MRAVILALLVNAILSQSPLEDATAYIDQLFLYPIPTNSNNIKIVEAQRDTLPEWLHYDVKSHTLKGVPGVKDRGVYILTVSDGASEDVFAVTVSPVQTHRVAQPSTSAEEPIICKSSESITVVNVMFNANLNNLGSIRKSALIESLTNHLSLLPQHVSLRHNTADLSQSAALVAGPGDDSESEPRATFSWVVGCGAVKSSQMDILERLEASAKDGSLGKSLGHGVSGWQVTSNKPKIITNRRLKRSLVSATPSPSSSAGGEELPVESETTVKPTATVATPMKESDSPTTASPTVPLPTTPESTSSSSDITTPLITLPPPTPPPPPPPSPSTSRSTTQSTVMTTELLQVETTAEDTTTTTMASTVVLTTKPLTVPPPITVPPPNQNKPPRVIGEILDRHMLKQGQIWKSDIPTQAFTDDDGDEISYHVQDVITGKDVNNDDSAWIMVKENQVIALPLAGQDGDNQFKLVATDAKGLSTAVSFTLNSSPADPDVRYQEYEMKISSGSVNTAKGLLQLAYQLEMDGKVEMINVIDEKMGLVRFTEVLPDQNDCPNDVNRNTLTRLRKMKEYPLTLSGNSKVTVESVRAKPISPCTNSPPTFNEELNVNSRYTQHTVQQGELFTEELPRELFTDVEDIDLDGMTLQLSIDGLPDQEPGWISLDKHTMKGLIWDSESADSLQYMLTATDSLGGTAEHEIAFEIITPYGDSSHSFTVTMDINYSKFANDNSMIKFYEKLAMSFPDSIVTIRSVKPGSVKVQWSNRPSQARESDDECPEKEVKSYTGSVFTDGAVDDKFLSNMQPYKVTEVSFTPEGSCLGVLDPISVKVSDATSGESKTSGVSLLTIIIPVVIAAIVIIIVIIVIICCIRHKRKSKEVSKNNGNYIETGVPVVFDEEMRDTESRDRPEAVPLMSGTESKPNPPEYPQNGKETTRLTSDADYQPPTPPVSEPEENDRSL